LDGASEPDRPALLEEVLLSVARQRLAALLAPEVLAALDELIADHVAEALRSTTRPSRDESPWLTLAQAAERLDCSVDAVRMRAKRGRLVTRNVGRRVYVSRASVDGIA
jgi:excisionase family DNA binding protein